MRLGGVAARQRIDMHVAARRFQQLVEILRQRGEALLVIRFATQTRNGKVIGSGMRREHGQTRGSEAQTDAQGGLPADFHTTPHFRRRSHSEERNSRIRRKMTGMFHKSFVSRTVMPASEYEISLGSLDSSCGFPEPPPVSEESFSSSSRFCSVWKFSATPSIRAKVRTSRPTSSLARAAVTSA